VFSGVERVTVNHVVEVCYTGGDWADLVADMRSWLDRRQIETDEFEHSVPGRGIDVRVGFRDENHAAAFASAFSGRLESPAPYRTAAPARDTIARPIGEHASISEDLTTFGAQPAVKAGASLMITRQQKADLRALGYTAEQIRDIKPEEAHRVLGLIDERPPS
jgi:hypothetical protein